MVGLAHLFDRACVENMSFTATGAPASLEELVAHVMAVLATDLALKWSKNKVGYSCITFVFAIGSTDRTFPPSFVLSSVAKYS